MPATPDSERRTHVRPPPDRTSHRARRITLGLGTRVKDARAAALARYLYQRAAAFSLSADVNDAHGTAHAGMALLDAAALAEQLRSTDESLRTLSEAGRFETMPDGKAVFLETSELRAAIQRPLLGSRMTGQEILALVVETAGRRR
ncbi:hypothetical protein Pa4123_39490 [Phytohabitans aurantiacus]|uniref:Uncharacterized protein n=1 Tax=Phytohabitans aurantiacus TaxID=3016789 RepID=A0ABQ5QWV1_9ACTN|nr:hypothetical protein Pa4123_39490 [Phytohabitans aurantiacus]